MRSSLFLAVTLALGAGLSSLPPDAQAQTARAVLKTAESTMVLSGTIDIGTGGQVEAFQLDKRDQVPEALASFVEAQVNQWTFQPIQVDGKAVRARAPAKLRLVARPDDEGGTSISIVSANFDEYQADATDSVTGLKVKSPVYPRSVYAIGGQGEVLLLVKVGRDGKTAEAFAEQVNLHVYGRESTMDRMREELSRVSVAAARGWTFRVPTTGEQANKDEWNVRVPVRFSIHQSNSRPEKDTVYGKWEAYIPGPRLRAPWRDQDDLDAIGTDLLASGGVYMADASKGPRLLTPLGS